MKNLFSLADKVIVVTGGLGQIGMQFVAAIENAGGIPVIFDLASKDSIGDRYQNLNKKIHYFQVDITSKQSIQEALAEIVVHLGVPHGLVNNAALDSPPASPVEENGPFETYPEYSWDKVFEVNAKGVFLTCQLIGGAMASEGRGSIVNICSTYGLVSPDQNLYEYRRRKGQPFFKPVAYAASKSALLNLTRYTGTYFAPKGVRVNLLTPGGVFNGQDEEFLAGYCARTPLGRMAKEDEYNGAIVFLLSDASSYMTGANLVIDGGWTAW